MQALLLLLFKPLPGRSSFMGFADDILVSLTSFPPLRLAAAWSFDAEELRLWTSSHWPPTQPAIEQCF